MKNNSIIQFLIFFLIIFLCLTNTKNTKNNNNNLIQNENENENEWIQQQILIANDGEAYGWFGNSIDLKGNICVIGTPYANVGNNTYNGKAYIFEKNGTIWNQIQILIASDGEENDAFGWRVSISNDGKYILIGSPYAKVGNNTNQGKAYIFEKNGTIWNQIQILTASDGEEDDAFGSSISISNDSKYIVIGTSYAKVGNNTRQGKVYIFENNGTIWNQSQILTASDGEAYDNFGSSVSISNDSNYLVIGAQQCVPQYCNGSGKAYIFQNNGTFWNQQQILIADDQDCEQFGYSVSISNDSSFILIGAPYSSVNSEDVKGKAYIFQNNGTYWNKIQALIASDQMNVEFFGHYVFISNDFCFVSAPYSVVNSNPDQGQVYVFQNNGTIWNQSQILISSDGEEYNYFGTSISISNNFAFISSPLANVGNHEYQGKVYVFESFPKPPQVNILNCSSLFSSFECYWNQINSTLNDIEYQIHYDTSFENWELIQSPILNQNILYQIFNSSIYQDITGNVEYSIQIKSCNTTTTACSNPSNQINLTTRIDSVKNLNYKSYSNSIQLNWNYPNVPIINSIPSLDHYILTYQILNSNQSTNISISKSSTSYQINYLESLTNYSISIYACRNKGCFGDDKGEISTIQVQTQQETTSSSSSNSKTTIIVISTVIPIIVIISIILIIFFIKKKRRKQNNSNEKENLI